MEVQLAGRVSKCSNWLKVVGSPGRSDDSVPHSEHLYLP